MYRKLLSNMPLIYTVLLLSVNGPIFFYLWQVHINPRMNQSSADYPTHVLNESTNENCGLRIENKVVLDYIGLHYDLWIMLQRTKDWL